MINVGKSQATLKQHTKWIFVAVVAAALGGGWVLIAPASASNSIDSTTRGAMRPQQAASEVSVPVSRWLLPDDEYFMRYPATSTKNEAGSSPLTAPSTQSEVPNGPASQRLLALVRGWTGAASTLPALPQELVDITAPGAPTIGSLLFSFPDGRVLTATQQQLIKPLPYSIIRVTDESQLSVSQNGTVTAVVTSVSTIQVLSINMGGLMTQVTARGVLTADVRPPLTIEQLRDVSNVIDAAISQGK
jgi:hypothetical protein